MDSYKQHIWKKFCKKYKIAETVVPLFKLNNSNSVSTIEIGRTKRPVLERSPNMEKIVINEVNKVLNDYSSGNDLYEGLIYMMCRFSDNITVPLYIGKSEKYGRYSGNLSENIKNIESNRYKFCRWGYGYDYHIGDLSAVLCKGHPDDKIRKKYKKWADSLFEDYPSSSPKLKYPVYFWIKAWKRGEIGIWEDFGSTSLTFLEYLLIGIASDLFPEYLLNEEGVNRS